MPQTLNGFQGVLAKFFFSKEWNEINWFLSLGSQKLMGLEIHPNAFKQIEHVHIHVSARTPKTWWCPILSFLYQDDVKKANSLQ